MTESDDAAAPTPQPAGTSRRTTVIAGVLMAVGAAAFWGSSRLIWATVYATDAQAAVGDGLFHDRYLDVHGADWSPWLTPLALVLLAAILAAFSLRGWGLRVLTMLLAVGGVLAAFPAISMLTSGNNDLYAARAIDLSDRYAVKLVTTHDWVAAVVLAGSACTVAAAVLLLRSASGAGMSSKYRTPAARREELEREIFADYERRKAAPAAADKRTEAPGTSRTVGAADPDPGPDVNERMMWDALDTGIDPTDHR
ncbi:MAG: TIGR02234 family membrane protein [Gordonia sp. (in: high G+C Gram-positive bacteria)]